jgi:DNA (cytosine-5)-methyltransferase 1
VGDSRYVPTVLSFCSGYAGIERGLNLAGVEHRVLAYVEIEAFAIANLVSKMETGELAAAPVYTDIKTFPYHLFRGAVDLITGGYPCQPFSAAGKRKGAEDPRHLWPYISRAIEVIRPSRVFFENVEGHISLGLNDVLADLEDRGYDATWGIFSAAEVGAPHQRKRVFIMADSEGQRWRERLPHSRGCAKGGGAEEGRRPISGSVSEGSMADTRSAGLQRPAWCGSSSAQGQPAGHAAKCDAAAMREWPSEPGVGRVVDGCPDRVDRIRLLGNGVVPQTAAIAWRVLNAEITETET